ncbi:MAG: F0F1 ATP synthase subunit B, partial [Bacteroidia bacterium]
IFLLRKFAWKPILSAVEERETKISDALDLAEKTKQEMTQLKSQNEELIKQARQERDAILKSAREAGDQIISDARSKSIADADKIKADALAAISIERQKAITEIKNQVATLSLDVAEKLVRQDLSNDARQKELAEKLVADAKLN